MIEEIENKKLLTPFYLEILKGVHDVGKEMNLFEISWKKQIQKIKKELEEKFGMEYRELDDLLKESDFVSIHTALTDETRHLINAEKLALMKPSAYLINTARGPIVDEMALIESLKGRKLQERP